MGLFAGVLACLLLAGAVAWQRVPEAWRRAWLPDTYEPIDRSPEYYLALYRSEAVEHYVHYHGTDAEVDRNLRAADVLFVGTSRMMLGFDRGPLRAFFEERGLKHYLMGFAYGETAPFTEAVMRRADLKPRWVIANTDGFFYSHPSHYGREVMHSSVVNAMQVRFETGMTLSAIRAWHRWMPYLSVDRTKSVWLRSRIDGGWQAYFVPQQAQAFDSPRLRQPGLDPQVLKVARSFQDECTRRGARLVLTFVPSPVGYREQGEVLARELGVPFVAPETAGLESYDGSHLTAESASRFTTEFLEGLGGVMAGEAGEIVPKR